MPVEQSRIFHERTEIVKLHTTGAACNLAMMYKIQKQQYNNTNDCYSYTAVVVHRAPSTIAG